MSERCIYKDITKLVPLFDVPVLLVKNSSFELTENSLRNSQAYALPQCTLDPPAAEYPPNSPEKNAASRKSAE